MKKANNSKPLAFLYSDTFSFLTRRESFIIHINKYRLRDHIMYLLIPAMTPRPLSFHPVPGDSFIALL